MTALACGGVRKTYGAFVALDDVALTVEPGEILGLAGPNGAGKTTLFDVLSGRVRPDKGSVTLGERGVTSLSTHRRARLGLARTFQAPLVPTSLTVGETLRAARDAYRPSATQESVDYARKLVGLQASDATLSGCARHARAPQAAARLPAAARYARAAHGRALLGPAGGRDRRDRRGRSAASSRSAAGRHRRRAPARAALRNRKARDRARRRQRDRRRPGQRGLRAPDRAQGLLRGSTGVTNELRPLRTWAVRGLRPAEGARQHRSRRRAARARRPRRASTGTARAR